MKKVLLGMATLAIAAGCARSVDHVTKNSASEPPAHGAKGAVKGDSKEIDWFTKDYVQNGVEGVGAERVYKDLELTTPEKPVLVAVIDSGVDSEHEDLKNVMWVNPGESGLDANGNDKRSNGIDDDGNGFVDDVHGWNFLGKVNDDGTHSNMGPTNLEMTRELVRMKKKEQDGDLSDKEKEYLAELREVVGGEVENAQEQFDKNNKAYEGMKEVFPVLADLLKKDLDVLTKADVEALNVLGDLKDAKEKLLSFFADAGAGDVPRILRRIEYYGDNLKYYFNEKDFRKEVIGDDTSDFNDHAYGNNDVKALDADHGTHVSGIIAAERNNGKGINGIANNVRIMGVRAVPNGDEYDKDVANAVRYAVDNGARVINMSFGKSYSPYKEKVDEAFQYAADNGVLIVHAAGNDSQNNNTANNFPNRNKRLGGEIAGWLEVGASSKDRGLDLPAYFSNFGDRAVDLFAPGVNIRSSVPDIDKYDVYSGTSMASPAAAGVAALILTQYPELDSATLKELMMRTVRDRAALLVNRPSDGKLVVFKELSITGGIADVFRALTLSSAD